MDQKQPEENDDVNALETPESPEAAQAGSPDPSNQENKDGEQPKQPQNEEKKKQKFSDKIRGKIASLNIYLVFFIFIAVLSGVIIYISWQRSQTEEAVPTLSPQDLTDEALDDISDNTVKVGDPKQTLNVESNAIFSGQVLVRGSLDVAGALKVGSALNLPGLTVSGSTSLDEVQANELSVAGNTTIQGTMNVQSDLTVAGTGTFEGNISAPQITAQSIQLSGDLTITRHIDAGGGTPSRSNGNALGGGGTTSISGTDTAGTVNINTGNGPGIGCFVRINFAIAFNTTPHVVITPVGSPGAAVNYYITKNSSGFSICTSNAPPGNSNFAFDYIVID